jgi:hypothetical protein
MFSPISVPFGCKMLFNIVDLKDEYTIEDVELLLGEMCNVVKNNYGDDNGGFIGGQVFENSGFISDEGSVMEKQDSEAVAKYLNDNFSVPVGRIKAFGMSDKEQAFRPDSHSGNRRVEVKYVKSK